MSQETFTYDDAHSALCIWEYIQNQLNADDEYWIEASEEGINQLRHHTLDIITPRVQVAYEGVTADYDDCFDFEFVPNVLERIKDPLKASQEEYNEAAKEELKRSTSQWEQECCIA